MEHFSFHWTNFREVLYWRFSLRSVDQIQALGYIRTKITDYTWYDNKVRELIAVKVLHTSLLNITVIAFKGLGSYAPMPAPSSPFKTILELV